MKIESETLDRMTRNDEQARLFWVKLRKQNLNSKDVLRSYLRAKNARKGKS